MNSTTRYGMHLPYEFHVHSRKPYSTDENVLVLLRMDSSYCTVANGLVQYIVLSQVPVVPGHRSTLDSGPYYSTR
jgi:hypothetical protein